MTPLTAGQAFMVSPETALQHGRDLCAAQIWPDAEAAIDAALRLWPRDEDLLIQRAYIDHSLQRWAGGHRWYAELRQHHPEHFYGWSRDAEMLRWLNRPQEAEVLLAAALERFPANEEVLIQRILVACDLRDWAAAEARAEEMLDRLPDGAASYRYAAEVYARQERFQDAELLIAEGLQLLGFTPVLSQRFAELASLRKDWKAAARRWRSTVRQLPDLEAGHRALATALRELGRLDEQERTLAAACQRLPNSLPLAIEHAWAASARRDWAVAVPRWQALLARAPEDGTIQQGLDSALMEARLPVPTVRFLPPNAAASTPPVVAQQLPAHSLEAVTAAPLAESHQAADRTTPSDLSVIMTCFESLGLNCEFGLAQRHAGVEALGLLRFSFIRTDDLIAGLNDDFAGVGEPPFTRVYLRDEQEYMTSDTRYGLHMHSFTGPSQVALERFCESAYRRFQFLARKMRDDLREAGKIYVRSAGDHPLSRDDAMRLHTALCRHARNTLLYVEPSNDPGRIGRVEWIAPGLMWGWTGWYDMINIDDENWWLVCRAAHALWTAERRRAPAEAQLLAG